jgi:hypothetical protein
VLRDVTITEATWNQAQDGNPWSAAGCTGVGTDRVGTADSTTTINGIEKWFSWNVTDMVQKWVNGTRANNGMLMRAETGTGFYAFSSSEGTIVERRPKLTITYRGGGPPPASTATPTPTATTPLPGDVTVTGKVYDANVGMSAPIAGANVAVQMCVPSSFSDVSGADGMYSILVPALYLDSCTEVTLQATAAGYQPYSQIIQVALLRANPVRNVGMLPVGAPTLTPTPTATTPAGGPTTITIQRGLLGDTIDTYMYQYDADNTDLAWEAILRLGFTNPMQRGQLHALLRFDLSPIPGGANILDAKLELYSDGWSGGGAQVTASAYGVVRNVTITQATWNQAQVGNPWAGPGCAAAGTDREATAQSTVTINGIEKWFTWNVTDLVQRWVDGALTNNGVVVRAESGAGSYAFSSAEGSTVALRPRLVVTYATSGAR